MALLTGKKMRILESDHVWGITCGKCGKTYSVLGWMETPDGYIMKSLQPKISICPDCGDIQSVNWKRTNNEVAKAQMNCAN